MRELILVVNVGSSSIKFSMFETTDENPMIARHTRRLLGSQVPEGAVA